MSCHGDRGAYRTVAYSSKERMFGLTAATIFQSVFNPGNSIFSRASTPLMLTDNAAIALTNTSKALSLSDDAIRFTTSSNSLAPSRTYTIYNRFNELYKFGVTDKNLFRFYRSLKQAGPGAYGKYSGVMTKQEAHMMEKYLRSLQYNSTGKYTLPGMKIPYPRDFKTGLPIKP